MTPSKTNTEFELWQEALLGCKDFLQAALDALSAQIAILDSKGVIITVNAAWRRFAEANGFRGGSYGLRANYLAVCDSASGEWSEGASAVAAGIRGLIEKSRSEFQVEYPFHCQEGQRWFLVRATRFAGEDPARIVIAHENITAQKLAEEALRKSHADLERRVEQRTAELLEFNEQLTGILNNISDGFLTVDRKWRYTRANPAALKFFRMRRRDLLGKTFWEVFPTADQTRLGAAMREAMEERRPVQVEELFPKPRNRWCECRCNPSPSGLSIFLTDITERKQAEEISLRAYEELERRVRERTADLTETNSKLHAEIAGRRRLEEEILQVAEREQRRLGQELHDDLGQQLTGIGMLAKLLSSELDQESHAQAADAMQLAGLVKQAIASARRLAKGFYPIELERGGLILALTDLAERVHTISHIDCEVRHDEGFRFDEAQSIHLYRIVQESLNNAVTHGKPKHIVIECTAREGVPVLCISNDGVGFQKPKDSHAGMGLNLFQYRARLLGATLTVESRESGGCRVTCYLKGQV